MTNSRKIKLSVYAGLNPFMDAEGIYPDRKCDVIVEALGNDR